MIFSIKSAGSRDKWKLETFLEKAREHPGMAPSEMCQRDQRPPSQAHVLEQQLVRPTGPCITSSRMSGVQPQQLRGVERP